MPARSIFFAAHAETSARSFPETMPMRAVRRHTALFLDLSEDLLRRGYRVRFRAEGTSMRPAIEDGDVLTLDRLDPFTIRPGDIVLSRRQDRPMAHRVAEVRVGADERIVVVLRGDGKGGCDAPVPATQLVGRVVGIERLPIRRRSLLGAVRWALASIRAAIASARHNIEAVKPSNERDPSPLAQPGPPSTRAS